MVYGSKTCVFFSRLDIERVFFSFNIVEYILYVSKHIGQRLMHIALCVWCLYIYVPRTCGLLAEPSFVDETDTQNRTIAWPSKTQ